MADLSEETISRLGTAVTSAVRIGEGRYALDLPLEPPPQILVNSLTAAGGRLISLNPLRQTLEDFFVERVAAARDRSEPASGSGAHPSPEGESPRSSPRTSEAEPASGSGAPRE